jgi:hypothetical protein
MAAQVQSERNWLGHRHRTCLEVLVQEVLVLNLTDLAASARSLAGALTLWISVTWPLLASV